MVEANSIAESPKERKDYVLTLHTPDGSSDVYVHLQEAEDAAHPPTMINISKEPSAETSTRSIHSQDRVTHIIVSTGSGHQKASSFYDNIVQPIINAFYPGEVVFKHTTSSETSVLETTQDTLFPAANKGIPLRIILLSGDGGIVDLVNGFSFQAPSASYIAPEIVILPLGTANALHHSINAGKKNTWGIPALSSDTIKPLPVFTTAFSPGAKLLVDEARQEEDLPKNGKGEGILHGAVVCSWGMHASLVADSDTAKYRKFGVERFKMAAKEALYPTDGSLPHAYKAKVSYFKKDGNWTELPEKEHMYVLSTLVSSLEAPLYISPSSKPLDGSMHLVHFGPVDGDEAMRIMGLAYQGGKHIDDEKLRYENIEGLRIEFLEDEGRWRRVCVDGKIVMVEKGGWVEMRKSGGKSMLDVVVAEE